jgi:hypothetical protein
MGALKVRLAATNTLRAATSAFISIARIDVTCAGMSTSSTIMVRNSCAASRI